MKDILQSFANANGWIFEYGRADFQNLIDIQEQKGVIHAFLDPVIIEPVFNDMQQEEGNVYSGTFMLLMSSDLDEESYNFRYETYIKPIIETQLKDFHNNLICENQASVKQWRITEAINVFDYNCDGVIVQFNMSIDN